jgi:CheY-like chemotaxis protein
VSVGPSRGLRSRGRARHCARHHRRVRRRCLPGQQPTDGQAITRCRPLLAGRPFGTPGRMAASCNGRAAVAALACRIVGLRCVIVDDSPDFLRTARALLEQEGLQVVGVASTGADALVRVAELRPDVTLVDVDLGGTSGFELARRLAADPQLEAGRLILISVHAEDDLADLIEASPAIGFVWKPTLCAAAIEALVRDNGGDARR